MHFIDFVILVVYMLLMLAVGMYFHRRHQGNDDYYVGGRNMNSLHIGLSVVATDVGGGFSIGLGGLGFAMGLSGSWMLFTGLLGAWLSAVLLIPRICRHPQFRHWLTLPQWFGDRFGPGAALAAGLISAIGYTGFTSSQLLAGAKLAAAAVPQLEISHALLLMGSIAVIYTVLGGLKAVIYTDTIQWLILLIGLGALGLPIAWYTVGGWSAISSSLSADMLSLSTIDFITLANWAVTIIPIWFVGMTLFQRILACKDERTARRAWFMAGLFEWPVMAFLGVGLGLLARVAAEQTLFEPLHTAIDPEQGLPLLLVNMLPAGLLGILLAAYLSAILSTADSCLMAASGNVVTDLWDKLFPKLKSGVRTSQWVTLIIGTLALLLAWQSTKVLELMLSAYAFLVSGLLVPMLFGLFSSWRSSKAAVAAMLGGGITTLSLQHFQLALPFGLDANWAGLLVSLLCFLGFAKWRPQP
jgi:solute:Na+ symporter, SSS family